VYNPERYPFFADDTALGEASFRPYLPFTLSRNFKNFNRLLVLYELRKYLLQIGSIPLNPP